MGVFRMDKRNDKKEFSDCNDELIIEENTIYEIDLDCLECMKKNMQDRKAKGKKETDP